MKRILKSWVFLLWILLTGYLYITNREFTYVQLKGFGHFKMPSYAAYSLFFFAGILTMWCHHLVTKIILNQRIKRLQKSVDLSNAHSTARNTSQPTVGKVADNISDTVMPSPKSTP